MEPVIEINDLPSEIFTEILKILDGASLGRCRKVCKKWRDFIDNNDHLWQVMCMKEFEYSSQIAKRKAGRICDWYHIYKNLKLWLNIKHQDKKVRLFYEFSLHDKTHTLNIDHGILPLKDTDIIVCFDMIDMKCIPVVIPDSTCSKISNNDLVTLVLTKSGLYVQKNETEAFFEAQNFVLINEEFYFHNNKDVYKCDLTSSTIKPELIAQCIYSIKEMVHYGTTLHLFTHCGKIINITKNNAIIEKYIECPMDWVKHLRTICAINDNNFICYSRHLFKINTDKHNHLYLEFPQITALFFYEDVVIIGTKLGQLLLYRLSAQSSDPCWTPNFDTLGCLPQGKFPVQIDVCEKRNGPMIVVTTYNEIYIVEYDFFPYEKKYTCNFPDKKLAIFRRLLRLQERMMEQNE